jgi:hypothetical protein
MFIYPKKPKGISFQLGIDENGFHPRISWLETTTLRPRVNGKPAKYGGIRFDLVFGTYRCPMPKFWKKELYLNPRKHYVEKEQNTNTWNSGNYWFKFTLPCVPGFYLFAAYGKKKQPGFYFGFKSYEVNNISCQLKEYKEDRNDIFIFDKNGKPVLTWCDENEIGNRYICFSVTIRDDIVD